jgi:hypothetical protein
MEVPANTTATNSHFKSGVCLLCCRITNEKLLALRADGLGTVRASAGVRGRQDIIDYIDGNSSEQLFVHNKCRLRFVRKEVLDRIVGEADGSGYNEKAGQKRKLRSEVGSFSWKDVCVVW